MSHHTTGSRYPVATPARSTHTDHASHNTRGRYVEPSRGIAVKKASGHKTDWGRFAADAAEAALWQGLGDGIAAAAGGCDAAGAATSEVGVGIALAAVCTDAGIEGVDLTWGKAAESATKAVDDLTEDSEGAAAKAADDAPRGGRCSFSAPTLVLMADGSKKPIKDVKVGDMVAAADPLTGKRGVKKVTHVWIHWDSLFEFQVDGQTIVTTEDHPFWSQTDHHWERTDELATGEQVLSFDGRLLSVTRAIDLRARFVGAAYNLTVDDLHTYYVGQDAVLVHNTGYVPAPKDLPGFPGAVRAKAKTPIQGGGGLRKRWLWDDKILEWDSQHGEVEMYNKRGKHLGAYDPSTGDELKGPEPGRTCVR